MARKSFKDLQQQRSSRAEWIYNPTTARSPTSTARPPPASAPPKEPPAPPPSKAPPPSAPPNAPPSHPPQPSGPATLASSRDLSSAASSAPASPAPAVPYRLASHPDLEVRSTKGKGRGLFWAPRDGQRTLQKGEEVLRLEPVSVSLLTNMLHEVCSGCLVPRPGRPCQCGAMVYCSSTCRERDSAHERECVALQVFEQRRAEALARTPAQREELEGLTKVPKESVRGMARLLFRRKDMLAQGTWEAVAHLSSPRGKLPLEEQAQLAKTASQLAYYLQCAEPTMDPNRVLEAYGLHSAAALLNFAAQYQGNAFALLDRRGNTLGTAIVPEAALMNHTCAPNTSWGYPSGAGVGKCFRVVCTQSIAPGQEVTTSYLPATTPLHLRDKTLLETYGFVCRCAICRSGRQTVQLTREALEKGCAVPLMLPGGRTPLWHDPRDGMLCPQGCGGWIMVPYLDEGELDALQERGGGTFQAPCPKCKVRSEWEYAAVQRRRLGGAKLLVQSRVEDVGDSALAQCIAELRADLPVVGYPLQELVGVLRR